LYENQDGWLCLCFEPEEAPYQRHVRGGDYVRVWSTYTLWAETRAGLLHEYWGHFGDDNPEIPGFIAPVPEVEDQHRETGYDR
jgi:hypothetical protein